MKSIRHWSTIWMQPWRFTSRREGVVENMRIRNQFGIIDALEKSTFTRRVKQHCLKSSLRKIESSKARNLLNVSSFVNSFLRARYNRYSTLADSYMRPEKTRSCDEINSRNSILLFLLQRAVSRLTKSSMNNHSAYTSPKRSSGRLKRSMRLTVSFW